MQPCGQGISEQQGGGNKYLYRRAFRGAKKKHKQGIIQQLTKSRVLTVAAI